MYYYYAQIPFDLLNRSNTDNDVSILIGENGSGKSTVLNEIAKHFLNQNSNVIALANTIYDKFTRNKKLKTLKSSSGRSLPTKTIIQAFKHLAMDDQKRMRRIADTLTYIGLDPFVSFRLKLPNNDPGDNIEKSNFPPQVKEDLLYLFYGRPDGLASRDFTIQIHFNRNDFYNMRNSYFLNVFKYESELRKQKIITGIDINLSKNGEEFSILEASSGEISLATTLIFITTAITENSVILIDEPENSLHPKWQTEYIKRLLELFYLYQPKIIVATHSPLILNGAEVNNNDIRVYKGKNGHFRLHQNPSANVEEIYQDFFDVTTPENRFISEEIIDKMNQLSTNQIDERRFEAFINDLKNKSYDEKQKEAFDGIIQLARQVANEIN